MRAYKYKLQLWVRTRSAVGPSMEGSRAGLPQTARSIMGSYAVRVAARVQYSCGQERTRQGIRICARVGPYMLCRFFWFTVVRLATHALRL